MRLNGLQSMTVRARFYWAMVVALGFSLSFLCIQQGRFDRWNSASFAGLLILALALASFKIRLPGVFGTLSMNYVVIFIVLLRMGPDAALVVALASTTGQCVISAKSKLRWYQVLFSVAGIPLPLLSANLALHTPLLQGLDPTGWPALLAAAFAYFAVNTLTVAGIISLTTGEGVWETWRASYLWTWPQYLVGGAIAGIANYYMGKNLTWGALVISAPTIYLVYRSYSNYLDRVREQQDHIAEMASLHLRTIETLALAIDAKDDTTAAHLRRVQIYAVGIGEELNLSSIELKALHAAALLHDVGKLAVPEYIISKPGKLTAEEFEKMKVHPVVGAEILERVNFPYPVVPIVRSHHEKFDGTGYPDGLAGEQIPIGARILSAVDCFDALASDRQYRKALSLEKAIEIVAGQSGSAFDPRVVAILKTKYRALEEKAKKVEPVEHGVLSTNVRVERGKAPATGLADSHHPYLPDARTPAGFSQSIASARREIQLLTDLINDLGNSLSLRDTLALLALRLEGAVKHDTVAVYLQKDGKLIPQFVKGESSRLFLSLEIPIGQGLSGWVAENNKPIVNGNPAVEAGFLKDPTKLTLLRSAISIPLRLEDSGIGVLTLYSLNPEAFTADHKRLLLAIAPKAAHAIQNSLRFQSTAAAADTDELTGLSNARSLFSLLEREVAVSARSGALFSVIVMDLDGFKQANDHYGHLAGNRILQSVAKGLTRHSRAGDIVARLGGDEFVVVQRNSPGCTQQFLANLESITAQIAAESICDMPITLSAGLAVYPTDGTDVESLLEQADERMYEAKRKKKLARVA